VETLASPAQKVPVLTSEIVEMQRDELGARRTQVKNEEL
jgi:hypothetical protein